MNVLYVWLDFNYAYIGPHEEISVSELATVVLRQFILNYADLSNVISKLILASKVNSVG